MTKKELINLAFEEIGIAYYSFDIQPEQYISALKRLDSLISVWQSKDLELLYVLSNPITGASLEDEAILSDEAIKPAYSNLALDLCPMFGKNPSIINLKNANQSYKALVAANVSTNEVKRDRYVLGGGYKPVSSGLPEITDVES